MRLLKFALVALMIAPIQSQAEDLTSAWVGLSETYDSFNNDFSPWMQTTVSAGLKSNLGSVALYQDFARRFGRDGSQTQLDLYPHLSTGSYAYINLGFSQSSLFPDYRFALEVYQSFDGGYEASLGLRKLWFSGDEVTIWTGSIAKYYRSFYFSLRLLYTPKSIGDSLSEIIEARYYKTDVSYIFLKSGYGEFSDQRVSTLEIFRNQSKWATIGFDWIVFPTWHLKSSVGTDVSDSNGSPREQTTLSLGLEKDF